MDIVSHKTCADCRTTQPLDAFGIDRKRKDGHNPYCRLCRSRHKKAYRDANKETLNAKHRAYKKSHRADEARRAREYRARHHDRLLPIKRAQQADYRRRNLQKSRDSVAAWREKNLEKSQEMYRRWRQSEHGKAVRNAHAHKRKAWKHGNGGSYTAQQWEQLKQQYNHRCLCCHQQEPTIRLTADHIVPLVLGGSSNIDNIQPLCLSCNTSKKDKTIDYRPQWTPLV